MSGRISAVIPVYNRSQELLRALESLRRQTFRNFDVVVCDDGSTEDIHAVVRPYRDQLALQYVRIENSGGPARPRNVAVAHARGEWIAFLDSDDWWDPERMARVSAALTEDVDLLYHPLRVERATRLRRAGERRRVIGSDVHDDMLRHMLLFGNPVPNSAVVVRRRMLEGLGGISEDPELIEDFDTWLRLAEAGGRFRYLDRVLGTYWVGEDGISAISPRQIEKYRATLEPHLHRLHADYRDLAWRCHHYYLGSMYLKGGSDRGAARQHLLAARGLPTLMMRLKRLLLLVKAWSPVWRTLDRKAGPGTK